MPEGWRFPEVCDIWMPLQMELKDNPRGNFILDCRWPPIADPPALAAQIKAITGVVEHGLFIGLAGRVIVAGASGVTVYEHPV